MPHKLPSRISTAEAPSLRVTDDFKHIPRNETRGVAIPLPNLIIPNRLAALVYSIAHLEG